MESRLSLITRNVRSETVKGVVKTRGSARSATRIKVMKNTQNLLMIARIPLEYPLQTDFTFLITLPEEYFYET